MDESYYVVLGIYTYIHTYIQGSKGGFGIRVQNIKPPPT